MKWLRCVFMVLLFVAGPSGKHPSSASPGNGSRLFVSHFENVLGTSMELKILAASAKDASMAAAAATREIARLQKILSAYDENSEFKIGRAHV